MSEGSVLEALLLGSSTDCRAQDVLGTDPQTQSFVCSLSNQENAPGSGSVGLERACWFRDAEASQQGPDPHGD